MTAMTPTPHGEGKTVTTVGLAMALARRGAVAVPCLRQPSLGPVFGVKGGASGGGRATVEPRAHIDLGFTGDLHAIGAAHNLLSALVDNHLHHGNELGIDPVTISWPRTVDMDDRALRGVLVNRAGTRASPREERYVITAASEVTAIHGLSTSYRDLRERLGRIVVARDRAGRPVAASALRAEGAMGALLRDALLPNLVRTSEGTPALVHGGPFANLAHGTCSVLATRLALTHADFAVVEAGFASELGAEKFVDLVQPLGGFHVDAAVIVATARALRYQGGAAADAVDRPDLDRLTRGLGNLGQHVANVRSLGMEPVVTLNRFPDDDPEEVRVLARFCDDQGVAFAVSDAFSRGGEGALDLADRVREAASRGRRSRPLYDPDLPPLAKVERIVRTLYAGSGVQLDAGVRERLDQLSREGFDREPVCVAKTPLSLSDDPRRVGIPTGFVATVHEAIPFSGAGFWVARMGEIVAMPGLSRHPLAERIALGDDGSVSGLEG